MGNQNIIDDKATDDKDATENTQPSGEPASENLPENAPVVYMTKDISPKGLIRIYEALGRQASGKVGIKVHMGEPGGNNYLNPDLIKDFVLSVKGTFVDCNTAYGGRRATTEMHMQAAKDHGFTAYTSVDIMDAEAEINLPVKNGKHLKEALVGSHIKDYDFLSFFPTLRVMPWAVSEERSFCQCCFSAIFPQTLLQVCLEVSENLEY